MSRWVERPSLLAGLNIRFWLCGFQNIDRVPQLIPELFSFGATFPARAGLMGYDSIWRAVVIFGISYTV